MAALDEQEADAVATIVGAAVVDTEVVWERHHVVRTTLDDGRCVIVKRPRRDGSGEDGKPSDEARQRFANERACLELLTGTGVAPELLGASVEPELLVMEALPAGPSLASLLLGDDRTQLVRASSTSPARWRRCTPRRSAGRSSSPANRGRLGSIG